MRRVLNAALAALVMITACGGGAGGLETELKLNDDPSSVLLMVKDEGGFVPVEFMVGQGPRLVLLRDGTLITPGPMIEIYPGPLVTNYQQSTLDEEMMLFVLEELDALDFDAIQNEVNDEAASQIADASTTVVTFHNQDGTHTFSVYALGIGMQYSDGRVPILANLVERISQVGFSGSGSYEWEAMQVMAGVSQNPPDPEFSTTLEWPLPMAFADMTDTGFGWRCATFTGAESATLLDLFEQANQATMWEESGTEYQIRVRPLFPGEEPCAPLAGAA
ncbi:MAG TPA: hypothetical protein VIA81_11680 [Acidimicrobiia bacterium]|jgi:hypothetical protein